MTELYVYSTMMSPENQGVFQLLKEVTFRRILAFYNSRKWGHFGVICGQLSVLGLAGGTGPRYFGNEGRIYQSVPQAPPRTLQRFVRRFLMAFNLPRQYNWSHVASSCKCCNNKADKVIRVDTIINGHENNYQSNGM